MQMPKGSRMICTAYFDNSADNLANPDPTPGSHLGRADLGRNDVRVLLDDPTGGQEAAAERLSLDALTALENAHRRQQRAAGRRWVVSAWITASARLRMDLSYGKAHEEFRRQTRRFIESHAHLAPKGGAYFDRDQMRAWQKLLIEHGYVARAIPKQYGGYGGEPDILKTRIIAEEFARAQVSPGLGGQGIAYLVPALLGAGQRRTKAAVHSAHAARRDHLVRGLLRAERRQRPGQPDDQRRAGRRRVGGQRPEDLDQHRRKRRLDVLPGPDRARGAQAPGLELPAVLDDARRAFACGR